MHPPPKTPELHLDDPIPEALPPNKKTHLTVLSQNPDSMLSLKIIRDGLRQAFAITPGPHPWRRAFDFGASVLLSTLICFLMNQKMGAGLAAFTILFIYFVDFGGKPQHRFPTILIGLLFVISCAILGHLAQRSNELIIGGVLALGLLTGWSVNTGPRVLQIFRFATVAFLIAALLPQTGSANLAFVALGAIVSFTVSSITDAQSGFSPPFQPGTLSLETRKLIHSPERHIRFTLAFGVIAALGLIIGQRLGLDHPYWITVTTIFTMQPESDVALVRLFQRVVGTLFAVPITLFVLLIARQPWVMGALLVITAALIPIAYARNFLLASALIVIFIIIGIDFTYVSHNAALRLLWTRMDQTLIGALLAIVAIFLTFIGSARETPNN